MNITTNLNIRDENICQIHMVEGNSSAERNKECELSWKFVSYRNRCVDSLNVALIYQYLPSLVTETFHLGLLQIFTFFEPFYLLIKIGDGHSSTVSIAGTVLIQFRRIVDSIRRGFVWFKRTRSTAEKVRNAFIQDAMWWLRWLKGVANCWVIPTTVIFGSRGDNAP